MKIFPTLVAPGELYKKLLITPILLRRAKVAPLKSVEAQKKRARISVNTNPGDN